MISLKKKLLLDQADVENENPEIGNMRKNSPILEETASFEKPLKPEFSFDAQNKTVLLGKNEYCSQILIERVNR